MARLKGDRNPKKKHSQTEPGNESVSYFSQDLENPFSSKPLNLRFPGVILIHKIRCATPLHKIGLPSRSTRAEFNAKNWGFWKTPMSDGIPEVLRLVLNDLLVAVALSPLSLLDKLNQ